ncbi:MAG: flavodoxin [Methanosphaera stadtmanae]|nr:flavodoxin [Methanosphaera stadtmanae]
MTDLVIYYSRTNNTELVAQTIQEETGADLLKINDKKNRSGPLGYLKGGFDAFREKTTEIEYDKVNLKNYDTVYLGTPVWASKPTPAILQFIRENDFGGVKVITFCTTGSSGDETTINYMNHLIVSGGGKVKMSFAIIVSQDDIKESTIAALRDE